MSAHLSGVILCFDPDCLHEIDDHGENGCPDCGAHCGLTPSDFVAAAVAAEREAVWNEAAELADAVIVSWSGVAGLHPTEPEPHPAAIAAAGARRTLVVLRSRVSEAFEERRALIAEARS